MNLHDYIECGDGQSVREILAKCPQAIHEQDQFGNTPLHTACWQKQLTIVGELFAFQPDVNARGLHGWTPLHYAVHEGSAITVPLVGALLARGADPSIRDENGFTPVDWAKVEMSDGLDKVLRLFGNGDSAVANSE